MATPLSTVAQSCEDLFYGNYKADAEFFEYSDFLFYAGAEAADYLRQEWKQKYDELRSEDEEEVVDFSDDWLLTDTLPVDNANGVLTTTLKTSIFSLPFDAQNSGLQDIFVTKPVNSCVQLERTTSGALWRLKYLPVTDRIFWSMNNANVIQYYNNGIYNIQEVTVNYVPSIGALTNVPDSIVTYIITNTVSKMVQLLDKKVVKKSLDQNINKVLETEIDRKQLAQP